MPLHLRTLGPSALLDERGNAVPLRKKDVALLAILAAEGKPVTRERLATLLWGEESARARHSLSQTVGRVRRAVGGCLVDEGGTLRLVGVGWDGAELLATEPGDPAVDDTLPLYGGTFLEGMDRGIALDFEQWLELKREVLRTKASRLLEARGAAAEQARDWARALAVGRQQTVVEPQLEAGHRRVMRAHLARGDRKAAKQHLEWLRRWMQRLDGDDAEDGGEPYPLEPETEALAREIEAMAAEDEPPLPPRPRTEPFTLPPVPEREPEPAPPASPPEPPARPKEETPPPLPPPSAAEASAEDAERAPAPERRGRIAGMVIAGFVAVAAVAWWLSPPRLAVGESVRVGEEIYLVGEDTLYRYPDPPTFETCTGMSWPNAPRVRGPLRRPVRDLPSVRDHGWMDGALPVPDESGSLEVYVVTGCVRRRVKDETALPAIFAADAPPWGYAREGALDSLPRGGDAPAMKKLPPGTVLRTRDGRLLWVTHHGAALAADSATLATHCRAPETIQPADPAESTGYRVTGRLRPGDGSCE